LRDNNGISKNSIKRFRGKVIKMARYSYGGRVKKSNYISKSDLCDECGQPMNMRYKKGNKIVCKSCKLKEMRW